MRAPSARAAACLALIPALLLACASPGGDPFERGIWPLYTADRLPWAGVRETRALGPLLHWHDFGDRSWFEARPLFMTRQEEGLRRWDAIYPLAYSLSTPDVDVQRILFGRSVEDHVHGSSDSSISLFFRGRTRDGRKYGGLFPLMGRFLERFGFDKVEFALWPLFARGTRGEYKEVQILWPFFAFGSGDGDFKFKLWPLFGIEKRDGVYDRRFFVWPFIHHRRERLDTAQPSESVFVLPLYGQRDRGPSKLRFYLFPLYTRQWHSERPEIQRTDLLWPLITFASGSDGAQQFAVRPLYERKSRPAVGGTPAESSMQALLGIVGRRSSKGPDLDEVAWRLLWAGQISSRREGGEHTVRHDIWPLYRFKRVTDARGRESGSLRLPALLPMRGLEPDGWDRSYQKLFEIWSLRWVEEEQRSSLLWGLREVRRRPGVTWESWAGLVHLHR